MKESLILAPIVLLFSVGVFIALRSGSGETAGTSTEANGGVRLVAGNFSALLLRVVGYIAVLAAVQFFVGFPTIFMW
jgi:hypothetical protein